MLQLALCLLALAPYGPQEVGPSSSLANPAAVREVLSGKRSEANAAWWGFNPDDSTDFLQAAILSGAKRVVVPKMGGDWVVKPIELAGNQELVLQPGVVVTAKRGEFRGGGDSVFTATGCENLTIRGYGATIRMQKEDYITGIVLKNLGWHRWYGQYDKAEWRMGLSLRGCKNVKVLGLTIRDTGGDGIYVDGGADRQGCERIVLRDVLCDNNYRQGISIISVDGFLAEDCSFNNTWGTPPSSGVDIEPDSPKQIIRNLVFRNCRFEDNYGDGIEVFLAHLDRSSGPVSILFDRCTVASRRGSGIRATKVNDDGPEGLVEFRDCLVDGAEAYGIKVKDKSSKGARVRFVRCTIQNAAQNRNYADTWVPVVLNLEPSNRVQSVGGVEFEDCLVADSQDRPAVALEPKPRQWSDWPDISDVSGTLVIRNSKLENVSLRDAPPGVRLDIQRLPEARIPSPRHVVVYGGRGRFGGFPANHGIWSWGNEILVGFSAGIHQDLGPSRHNIARDLPEEHLLARSLDGGLTWKIENPAEKGALIPVGEALHGVPPPGLKEKPWTSCPGGIDFTHPNFALTVRMTSAQAGSSRFYYSYDRGKSWKGPFRLPLFGQKGIAARTDYVVNDKHDLMLFLTASKGNRREGRPLCVRTRDGGRTWRLEGWIGPAPSGYAIMPSTVRLGRKELLTAIRLREGDRSWIETWRSRDDGRTWKLEGRPAPDLGEGNPASLIRLKDGRLCLTYGVRKAPFGVRARLSKDRGQSWSDEIYLRDDAGNRDVGYVRTVQRPDGKVVTVYYIWDRKRGPERYIAATLWEPPPSPVAQSSGSDRPART